MQQSTPTMKSVGGCTDIEYAGDARKRSYEKFIERWPGRFAIKEYPDSVKRWRLHHLRKFFSDYKQTPILKK
jgi:hypothetical protein